MRKATNEPAVSVTMYRNYSESKDKPFTWICKVNCAIYWHSLVFTIRECYSWETVFNVCLDILFDSIRGCKDYERKPRKVFLTNYEIFH